MSYFSDHVLSVPTRLYKRAWYMIFVEISTFKFLTDLAYRRVSTRVVLARGLFVPFRKNCEKTCKIKLNHNSTIYYFLLILYNLILATKLSVQLKSYGCNDVGSWLHRNCRTATASIKVNGREYAKNTRGYNVVVFDNQGELRKELWFHKFAAGKISLVKFIRKNNSIYLYRVL